MAGWWWAGLVLMALLLLLLGLPALGARSWALRRAAARGATQGGRRLMLPWEGCWSDYRRFGELWVPFKGEVAWMRPEGRKTCLRGGVTALHYGFME